MSKIETVCPYCKKTNTVEKNHSGVGRYGLQNIRCSHCSKSWDGNLSETEGLTKSAPAPSSELAERCESPITCAYDSSVIRASE
jgi:phage FluMu protein Com